jgi:hypothetical protein
MPAKAGIQEDGSIAELFLDSGLRQNDGTIQGGTYAMGHLAAIFSVGIDTTHSRKTGPCLGSRS